MRRRTCAAMAHVLFQTGAIRSVRGAIARLRKRIKVSLRICAKHFHEALRLVGVFRHTDNKFQFQTGSIKKC